LRTVFLRTVFLATAFVLPTLFCFAGRRPAVAVRCFFFGERFALFATLARGALRFAVFAARFAFFGALRSRAARPVRSAGCDSAATSAAVTASTSSCALMVRNNPFDR
jgi:hypothetical protein